MTAFTDLSALRTAIKYPKRRVAHIVQPPQGISANPGTTGLYGFSMYTRMPTWNPGAAPGGAANPDNTSAGALIPEATDTTTLWLAEILAAAHTSGNSAASIADIGCFLVYDRLAHSDGLSGTTTGAQTTNLPLTLPARAPANGVGCFAAVEIYTTVGSTVTTAALSYKNTAGTTHSSPFLTNFGGTTNTGLAGIMSLFPLADGDTGVKTIESVTLAATTGTAGNFGCVIGQPLAIILCGDGVGNPAMVLPIHGGNLVQIPDGACLQAVYFPLRSSVNISPNLYLELLAARAQ